MSPSKKSILACATLAVLAGCGGGGDSAPAPAPAPAPAAVNGTMIDGYVSGATVFCDLNNNGVQDSGETAVTTDSSGRYSFPAGCNAMLVGFGGTNVDTGFAFTGQLRTPSGAKVMTPLTTLVSPSFTPVQLAAVLGLPVGTDVTTIDVADGTHADLLKKTQAVHQIMDSVSKVVAANSAAGTSLRAHYASIASSIAQSLGAASSSAPLFSSGGDVNAALVSTFVKAVPSVRALNIGTADLDATVAALADEAQLLAKASDTELANVTKALQDPVKPPVSITAASNYLSLADNSIVLNDTPVTLAHLSQGATLKGLSSVGFKLNVVGTPAAEQVFSVGLEVVEQGGSGRKLQLMIDQVKLTVDQGQIEIKPMGGAKVHVYGHTASGIDINMSLSDLSFKPISTVDNSFSLNYAAMVSKVLDSADNTTRKTAEDFVAIKGTFTVKAVLSNLSVRSGDTVALPTRSLTVTNSGKSVTGAGFTGSLVIN